MGLSHYFTQQPIRYVHPSRWWLLPAIAVPGAVAAGLLPEVLPVPAGIVLSVNLLLPAAIVIAAATYPRLWSPLAAGLLALTAFTLTRAAWYDHQFWQWRPAWLIGQVLHPIVVGACAVGTLLAFAAVLGIRRYARVGVELPSGACEHCGYAAGRNKICPECGKPNPNATI
jgi:hypothetical protein